MLHVRILPVRLEGAHAERCGRSGGGYSHSAWDRLIETRRGGDRSGSAGNYTNIERLLKGWIQANVLLPCPVYLMGVVNAVAGANGSRAFAERIPRDAKARHKIIFGNLE